LYAHLSVDMNQRPTVCIGCRVVGSSAASVGSLLCDNVPPHNVPLRNYSLTHNGQNFAFKMSQSS